MVRVLRYIAFAVAGYAAFTGLLYVGQRRMMYHPDQDLPPPMVVGLAEMAEVRLATADGLDLVAWYRPARADDLPTIVYYHGNGGNIAGRGGKVRPFLDAGHGVLLVSWRGYGGNPGSPTEEGLFHDGRAALAFLAAEGVPAGRIVLYGESLGTGIAVQMASEQSVGAVVLEAPYTSLADVAQHHYWYVPAQYLVMDRFDSLATIDGITAPLLVLHGERDDVVPTKFGRALYEAANDPKELRLFPHGGHNDMTLHGAAEATLDFLARQMQSPAE